MSRSEKRQKTVTILLRVNPYENKFIEENAINAGFIDNNGSAQRQKYIMSRLKDEKIRPPVIARDGARIIAEQLRKIGTNLNQITRNVNMGYVDDCTQELNEIHHEIANIRTTLEKTISLKLESPNNM